MSERTSDLLTGLFIGGLIGAVLGVLFAPKSGKETREDLARKADELLVKTKEEYAKAVEKSKAAYEAALGRLKEFEASAEDQTLAAEEKLSEIARQGIESVETQKNRLKQAIDAGLEAYREESTK
ncbi:MAG TPA: YtxH domain-containing protein [Smithella sp.]|nr:YtxH domain-containing protein [Smithella sp.]HRS97399.1 YtxH domain-containing protein [Smithella sp.]